MARRKFPVLGVILLVVAIAWLLGGLGSVPWFPVIILIVAVGMIVNRLISR